MQEKRNTKIIALEEDMSERDEISKMLKKYDVSYEYSAMKTINKIGVEDVDYVLIDADYSNKVFSWKELINFLKRINLKFLVFSSNGKVGVIDKQKIISINDIAKTVNSEFN